MRMSKIRNVAGACAAFFALSGTAVSAQDGPQEPWQWGAQIYFWGASVGGTTTTGGNVDIGISTIIEDLKIGGMATIAARKGPWLMFADLIYLNIAQSNSATGSVAGIPVTLNATIGLKGFISTFGGGYRFYEQAGTSLDVTAGARVLWLEGDVVAQVPPLPAVTGSSSGSNWDAVVGLRGQTDLNEKWYLSYYADVGTGESNFTWQAALAVNYRLNKVDLTLGYRYLDWNLKSFGPFNDLNLSGAFLGVKIPF